MTLRVRLLLTGLATAVPLATGYFLIDTQQRLSNKEQELQLSVELDVRNGLRERCETHPPQTGRPGRGGSPEFARENRGGRVSRRRGPGRGPGPSGAFEYFAYDAEGHASSVDAPLLPAEGREGGRVGTWWSDIVTGPAIVVRLAPDGPCAFVLARIPPRPRERRDQLEALALVVLGVLATSWIAGGPIIGRLRRLEAYTRHAAATQYAEPIGVEGQDEVAGVAAAFNEAGRQVRAHLLDVQKREATLRTYVANTTHDVATPLTVLQGHLAALDRSLAPTSPDRQRVQLAIQEAHFMASLLRNLGAVTALDSPDALPAKTTVDMSALVGRVVARHCPMARAQGVSLEFTVPEPALVVQSDPTLLEQALSNLVDNAVRYNRSGGHVAVVLDRDGTDDGFRLTVTDDGPGVAAEDLSQLTTRWFRSSEARTRRPDGKGLGLAIAAESVRLLGLSLSFASPTESGCGLCAEIAIGFVERHTAPRSYHG